MSWQTITKKNNLDISVVNSSELDERIDAEYYRPKFLVSDELVENKKPVTLDKLGDVKGGKRLPKGETFVEEGVSYIRAEDVKNSFIEYKNAPKVSLEIHKKLKSYQTKYNDVLITIVGNSIGDVGLVKFNLDKCNLTENCAKVVKLKDINADYLFSFLLSKYGQHQIEREKVGTSQPKLALVRIRDFSIPVPSPTFQDKISEIIKSSNDIHKKSLDTYQKTNDLLAHELNLENYVPDRKNSSVRTFEEALGHNRFDAEYWQPKYDEIEKLVVNIPQKKLGELVTLKKGIEVGSEAYGDEGKSFIRVADFSIYGIDEVEKRISEELYEELKENYRPQKGEVLFTKDGTIGLTYVLDESVEAVVSGAFLRLKPKKEINSHYFALVLNSIFCKAQIERLSGGAIIAHLKPDSVKKLNIPILPESKQKEIGDKVVEAFKLRSEAKELLEKAKKAVELYVEKNEKAALAFLTS